jgi:hypothetical protein
MSADNVSILIGEENDETRREKVAETLFLSFLEDPVSRYMYSPLQDPQLNHHYRRIFKQCTVLDVVLKKG